MFIWMNMKAAKCLIGKHDYDVTFLGRDWKMPGRVRCLRCNQTWDCLVELDGDGWITRIAIIHKIGRGSK